MSDPLPPLHVGSFLLSSGSYADTKVKVGETVFALHRPVLAQASFFASYFARWDVGNSDSPYDLTELISDDSEMFGRVTRHLYGCEPLPDGTAAWDLDSALAFLKMCSQLGFERGNRLGIDKVKELMKPEDTQRVREAASQHQWPDLVAHFASMDSALISAEQLRTLIHRAFTCHPHERETRQRYVEAAMEGNAKIGAQSLNLDAIRRFNSVEKAWFARCPLFLIRGCKLFPWYWRLLSEHAPLNDMITFLAKFDPTADTCDIFAECFKYVAQRLFMELAVKNEVSLETAYNLLDGVKEKKCYSGNGSSYYLLASGLVSLVKVIFTYSVDTPIRKPWIKTLLGTLGRFIDAATSSPTSDVYKTETDEWLFGVLSRLPWTEVPSACYVFMTEFPIGFPKCAEYACGVVAQKDRIA